MPVIAEPCPAASPSEAELFTECAEFVEPPNRDLITAETVNVNVKRMAAEVFRLQRQRVARANQRSLFRRSASRARNRKRNTDRSNDFNHVNRRMLGDRSQLAKMSNGRIRAARHWSERRDIRSRHNDPVNPGAHRIGVGAGVENSAHADRGGVQAAAHQINAALPVEGLN